MTISSRAVQITVDRSANAYMRYAFTDEQWTALAAAVLADTKKISVAVELLQSKAIRHGETTIQHF